jgi:hypothetical protein
MIRKNQKKFMGLPIFSLRRATRWVAHDDFGGKQRFVISFWRAYALWRF